MNAYLDTSVFLAIFNGESTGPGIRALLRELRISKARVYTSIITVQEASVEALRAGGSAEDMYGEIGKLARTQTITKEIAIRAAKLEAAVIAKKRPIDITEEERIGLNRRRKWDCFHIATALDLGCSVLYTLDDKMLNRKRFLDIKGIDFLQPLPSTLELSFDTGTDRIQ